MTLESSKNLGGIGALLIVIGGLAFFGYSYGGLLSLVGVILLLIGLKGMSDYYKEGGIFNNGLYAVIVSIVGGVVFAAILVWTILTALAQLGISSWADWVTSIQQNSGDFSKVWNLVSPIVAGVVVSFVVLYIFVIVAAILYRKSLNELAEKSEVGMFKTAGLLLLIGAVLTIILVGFILIWIAFILITVAFFSVRSTSPPPSPPPPTTSPLPPG
jgi:uncharacterized membrane protein